MALVLIYTQSTPCALSVAFSLSSAFLHIHTRKPLPCSDPQQILLSYLRAINICLFRAFGKYLWNAIFYKICFLAEFISNHKHTHTQTLPQTDLALIRVEIKPGKWFLEARLNYTHLHRHIHMDVFSTLILLSWIFTMIHSVIRLIKIL